MTDTRFVSAFNQVDSAPSDTRQELAGFLDRLAALPGIQRVRQVARAALAIHPGHRLLDAGCGVGEEARDLARLTAPDGEVTAIDLSRDLVALARQRDGGTGVRYAVGDVTSLSFPDATFDGVRSERVLQHLGDPDAAVAELARVTVPGGRVCLIDTDWESLDEALARDEFLAVLTLWVVTGVKPPA